MYTIFTHEDVSYKTIRSMPVSSLSKRQQLIPAAVEEWKNWLGADTVVIKDNQLIFCAIIPLVRDENLKLINEHNI
mgnify:CR=1 FL=1